MLASATNRFQGHFDYDDEYDEEDNNEREFNEDEEEIFLPLNGEFDIEDDIQCS